MNKLFNTRKLNWDGNKYIELADEDGDNNFANEKAEQDSEEDDI